MTDIVISTDFPPAIGGAHTWLYEVYRRWPSPVSVLAGTVSPDNAEWAEVCSFDSGIHGSLTISRAARRINDLNVLSAGCLRSVVSQLHQISLLKAKAARNELSDQREVTRLHALRAFPEGIVGLLYKLIHFRDTRLIVYAHGEELLIAETSRQLRAIAKLVYSNANLVIANSENTKSLVLALSKTANVTCIHPGVDVVQFRTPKIDRAEFRRHRRWPSDTVVVCTIGRMEARKNHAIVIRAIAELRQRQHPVALVCAGDGPEKSALHTLADDLGIAQWIDFPGAISEHEKLAVYCAADMFAMPSIKRGPLIEGFGIVFIEAAAAGLPAIGGNTGGQPEAILHGETGLIVDGSDLSQVVTALERLVGDAEERQIMGRNAKQWAERHSWDRIVDTTLARVSEVSTP